MPLPTNDSPDLPEKDSSLQARLSQLSPAQQALLRKKLAQRSGTTQPGSAQPTSVQASRLSDPPAHDAIAIVGMGCRFPGAANMAAYWQLIQSGSEAVSTVPESRWDRDQFYDPTGRSPGKMSVNRMGSVEGVDQFDPAFFGIAPREASRMDPQQRLLLEVAWETFENAGIPIDSMAGSNTGVFIGIGGTDYSKVPSQYPNYYEVIDAHIGTGNALSIASARISYLFDFKGPSFIVDTACSSALVAIHNAIVSLRSGESSAAVAGGVNLILSPETTIAFSKARMLSPEGHCRPFDDAADGYVRGEGCGLILLKRLADAKRDGDQILGIIRGSAVNQDGRTSGITAPSSGSQVQVIQTALASAGLSADDIDYVEAHGTGTPLGDPIELTALAEVFDGRRNDLAPVRIGSVKANIGHTETASGIAGLLKVLQMFQHDTVPAQANFNQLNRNVAVNDAKLRIAHETTTWKNDDLPRRAGVSSFGFGGTNAHLVIESFVPSKSEDHPSSNPPAPSNLPPVFALPLSATEPAALSELAVSYSQTMAGQSRSSVADTAFAAATGRSPLPLRSVALGHDADTLITDLRHISEQVRDPSDDRRLIHGRKPAGRRPRVAMLMTGQGSQYVSMANRLTEVLPVFAQSLEACGEILDAEMPVSLKEALRGDFADPQDLSIDHTQITQPAICAVQCALVDSLRHVGIRPDVITGHSIGEIAALYAAELISREDALRLSAIRGRVMGELPAGGGMAAILTSADRIQQHLDHTGSSVVIATMNGPDATVIAGSIADVNEVVQWAESEEIATRPLTVSHAFHSPLMQPACSRLRDELASFWKPVSIPASVTFLSSVTGQRFTGMIDVDYWIDHLVSPVRFSDVIQELNEQKIDLAMEIGPAPHLSAMIRRSSVASDHPSPFAIAPTLDPKTDDYTGWIRSVSQAWCIGAPVDWNGVADQFPRRHRHVALPNYPFQRSRYWLEPESIGSNAGSGSIVHPMLGSQQDLADGTLLFSAVLRPNDPGFLADHVVSDSVTVPAAAWIEAVRAAAAQKLDGPFEIRDLQISRALFLEDSQPAAVQTKVTGGKQRIQIEIAYRIGDNEAAWHPCVSALAIAVKDSAQSHSHTMPTRSIDRDQLYEQLAQRQLTYGDLFQTVHEIVADDESASAALRLANELKPTAHQYGLHPTLLDGCFHLFAAFDSQDQPAEDLQTFLPVGVKRIVFGEPGLPDAVTVRRSDSTDIDGFYADVELTGKDGALVARLHDVQMQSLHRERIDSASDPNRWVHEVVWTPVVESDSSKNAMELPDKDHLWKLSDRVDRQLPLPQQVEATCNDLLGWIQQAIRRNTQSPIAVVTQCGHSVRPDDLVDPVAASVLAFCRVVTNEHPGLGLRVLDLAESFGEGDDQVIGHWLNDSLSESELAYRDGHFYQGRIQLASTGIARHPGELNLPLSGSYRLRLDGTHRIEGLWAQRIAPPPTYEKEVSLAISAVGLNFSDVLKSMGLYPGLRDEVTPLGIEVCGRVTGIGPRSIAGKGSIAGKDGAGQFQRGDRVMGVVPYGFASDDATKDHLIVQVPDHLSDEEAASIPIAFLTAHHALLHVGRLQAGESVLIHAGAGGVGLAAIQVAVAAGATVYASAGNEIKRGLLRELGVPAENILDSRDIGSAESIDKATRGRGVDVVLNSLPGDWIEVSLALLAPHGRFLEIGKTDIYQNRPIGLAPFQDNLTYSAIDLDRVLRDSPEHVREIFGEIVLRLEQGVYQPTVLTTFALDELPDAMRFMAARKNIGKIVVRPPRSTQEVAASDGTHLITGGSGSIALGLARRLIQRGATEIALVARRAASDSVRDLQNWATSQGAVCHYRQADCTNETSMQVALDDWKEKDPAFQIVSVFHTAGVLDDGLIHEMTEESLTKVLAPKVQGAIVLDRLTAQHPVKAFVMIGSVAALLGSPGQANYAAANGFLEGFAVDRRSRGLPATTVHFGPWESNPRGDAQGMANDVADDGGRAKNLAARGLTLLNFDQAVDSLIDAMNPCTASYTTVVDADFGRMLSASSVKDLPSLLKSLKSETSEASSATVVDAKFLDSLATLEKSGRREALAGFLSRQLGTIMAMPADSIDPAESLAAFGLDSLMAIELKNSIEAKLDITLPISKFMNDPTLNSLAEAAGDLIEPSQLACP